MTAFDEFVPQFRRAKDRWPDAPTLIAHYASITSSYDQGAYGIIANIKSFVECMCLTIMGEYGKTPSPEASTTKLLGEALTALGMDGGRTSGKVGKLLSAHNKMADALSEMRNENDPLAHGKDGFLDTLSRNEQRAFLVTADSILALLIAACDGSDHDLLYTREPYERFRRFHSRVDRAVSIDAKVDTDGEEAILIINFETDGPREGVELRLKASEYLYALDRTAYVELLSSAFSITDAPIGEVESEEMASLPTLLPGSLNIPLPAASIVENYVGPLASMRAPLRSFLETFGGLEAAGAFASSRLIDSLLDATDRTSGLDWRTRQPLQAATKVALRKTFMKFGVEAARAEQSAERLLVWLKNNNAMQGDSLIAS